MEKEGASRFMSDDEFMKLVALAQTKSDVEAMNAIFQYFDPDINWTVKSSTPLRNQRILVNMRRILLGFNYFRYR
ncbi:UNVERIFIED_CONTAM: hypothetical protein ABIC26_004339, partial [Paenibacillus sp. PvR008]